MFMMFHVQWFNGVRPARKLCIWAPDYPLCPTKTQPTTLWLPWRRWQKPLHAWSKSCFRKFQTTQRVSLGPTLHKGLDLTSQGCKNSFHKSDSQSKLFDQCHLVFLAISTEPGPWRPWIDQPAWYQPQMSPRVTRSYCNCHISELGIATVAVAPLGHCLASSVSAVVLPQTKKKTTVNYLGKTSSSDLKMKSCDEIRLSDICYLLLESSASLQLQRVWFSSDQVSVFDQCSSKTHLKDGICEIRLLSKDD